MNMAKRNRTQRSFTLDDRFVDRLSLAAESSGTSMSRFIEEACRESIEFVEAVERLVRQGAFDGTGVETARDVLVDSQLCDAVREYVRQSTGDLGDRAEAQRWLDQLIAYRRGDISREELRDA